MSINEARERLELDPLAGAEYNLPVLQFGGRISDGEATRDEAEMEPPAARSVEVDAEKAQFRRWLAKRGAGADPDEFRVEHMSGEQKMATYGEWLAENQRDLHEEWAAAMARFEEALSAGD